MTSLAAPTVRIEHHPQPALGIDEERPRLSWSVPEAPAGYRQGAAEVSWEITAPDGAVVDTARAVLKTSDQVLVPWPGPALAPRQRAVVRVRTRGEGGAASDTEAATDARTATGAGAGTAPDRAWGPWSAPVVAERGLSPAGWRARLVGPGYEEGVGLDRRAPLLRREFTVPPSRDGVRSARLRVTAHGLAEVEINGVRVGADELLPGWTPYQDRLRVFTYDVTDLVTDGANAVGAWLADGWFRGRVGFEGGSWDVYGSHVGLLAQLEITTAEGTTTVVTDGTWRSTPGPLTRSSLYDGESYDARLHPVGWSEPGFDDSGWSGVVEHPLDVAALGAPDGPPVRCTDEIAPVTVTQTGPGTYLLDYGQNHSGRPRLRVPAGPEDTVVRVRHAEVLQDGALYTRTLREAASTDEITTGGEAVEWEPRFTIHGYRYAEVSGWPGELALGAVVSRVIHSDMERRGWFHCSHPGVERLHENVVWSLRSNFVDIPTDCPQRDERLGWTGDIQVFAPTAATLYDVHGVLADWLRTLASEQERFGGVAPVYAPWVPARSFWSPEQVIAAWGDVASLTPLALYERSGDLGLLERQLDSATSWVDLVADLAGPTRLWDTGVQLGDWLDPTAPPEDPIQAQTDPHLVATAYLARSAWAVARTAEALGRPDDARRYDTLAAEVRTAFQGRYLDDDPMHDTQTAHALAIAFDLHPDDESRRRAGARLAELVRSGGGTIGTGFAGTPVIADALTSTGQVEVAYELLLGRTSPSWLATVDLGATTIWERWDSMLPDGTVNSGDMTSFNHYALGSVADWMHRVVAGLAPVEPGYRRIRVAPRPGGGLTSAGSRQVTPYGEASVDWQTDGDDLVVRFTVPVGATAVVDVPGVPIHEVGPGTHEVRSTDWAWTS